MNTFPPTPEQAKAVELFGTGRPLKIAAFAGAGKTSTLILMAKSKKSRGFYLAFNRALKEEAEIKFKDLPVNCWTINGLAFAAMSPRFQKHPNEKPNKLTDTLNFKSIAKRAQLRPQDFSKNLKLTAEEQAFLIRTTVERYCQSDSREITEAHVPQYGRLLDIDEHTLEHVNTWTVEKAQIAWKAMIDPRDKWPLGHEGYVKLWALENPIIGADYVLLDEAQDINAVFLGVLRNQTCQIVYVGDRHQQIYEWRGATNAMEQVVGCSETSLTQSFRFGESIAQAASRVLRTLDEQRTLRGNPAIKSEIQAPPAETKAILARTNSGVMSEVIEALAKGKKVCIQGGAKKLIDLLSGADALMEGKPAPASCQVFLGFKNWAEVVAFSQREEGAEVRSFVQLVERHGREKLRRAFTRVFADAKEADVTVSTTHQAKGCEWDSVRLASDFFYFRPKRKRRDNEAEVRLFYVAMTRAKKLLVVDKELLADFSNDAWKTSSRAPISNAISEHIRTRPVHMTTSQNVRGFRSPKPTFLSTLISPLLPWRRKSREP